jgi:flagellar biosynthesis protein FlhF
MYIKKFEADSLDEALKAVKRELGPDAIILKTLTNKGLKGALKKKKIEITAGISERTYEKKAKVDKILDSDLKEKVYAGPASSINQMIEDYSGTTQTNQTGSGSYGQLGLNKVVNSVSKTANKLKSSLDDFLSVPEGQTQTQNQTQTRNMRYEELASKEEELEEEVEDVRIYADKINHESREASLELNQQMRAQKLKIDQLEQKLFELTHSMKEGKNSDEVRTLTALRRNLRSLELEESLIQKILKKASFELNPKEIESPDTVYDFALRELNQNVTVAMPNFSKTELKTKPTITILISEVCGGQTALALKMSSLNNKAPIVKFRGTEIEESTNNFSSQVLGIQMIQTKTHAEIISECRKAKENNYSLIVDLKCNPKNNDETKKLIDVIKRTFEHVEILVTVSAIASEIYNKKVIAKYREFSHGIAVTFLDMCMSYGAVVNLSYQYPQLPLMVFGTGASVPDDIEVATSERLVAGLFEL